MHPCMRGPGILPGDGEQDAREPQAGCLRSDDVASPLDYRARFCGNSEPDEPSMQFDVSTDPRRVARRFFISGDVQGVGYRFFAQRAAARHQVVGYVKNLSDGRVEAFVEGSPAQVEAFKHELATGPRFSVVAHIEEINIDPTGGYSVFRIEH